MILKDFVNTVGLLSIIIFLSLNNSILQASEINILDSDQYNNILVQHDKEENLKDEFHQKYHTVLHELAQMNALYNNNMKTNIHRKTKFYALNTQTFYEVIEDWFDQEGFSVKIEESPNIIVKKSKKYEGNLITKNMEESVINAFIKNEITKQGNKQ